MPPHQNFAVSSSTAVACYPPGPASFKKIPEGSRSVISDQLASVISNRRAAVIKIEGATRVKSVNECEADGDGEQGGWRFHPLQYLYFAVDDLEGALARVQSAGGQLDDPIATMPWGERMFYARDPFGSRISFVDRNTLFTGCRADAAQTSAGK